MSNAPTRTAARGSRRADTSLPARFSADQVDFRTGIITSLGTTGLFLQTEELVPKGTKVVVEAGLGGEHGELRWVAKVAYLNRRSGRAHVPGLGLVFDEPPASVLGQVEAFLDDYPGPVALDDGGRTRWPFAPSGAEGVEVLSVPGSLGELRAALDEVDAARVVLRHRGRALAPSCGVSKQALADGVRALADASFVGPRRVDDEDAALPPEAAALFDGLDAQIAIVDACETVEWKLEELIGATVSLEASAAALRQARAALDAIDEAVIDGDGAGALVPSVEDAARELGMLVRHVASIQTHVDAAREGRERSERREAEKRAARGRELEGQGVGRRYRWDSVRRRDGETRKHLALGALRDLARGRWVAGDRPAGAEGGWPPRWVEPTLAVLAFVALPLVFAGAYGIDRWTHGVEVQAESRTLASIDGAAEGEAFRVRLTAWSDFADPDARGSLVRKVKVLAARGFDEARFEHGGQVVAVWREGALAEP